MDLAKWLRAQWDRVFAWVCVAAGAIVLIVGWAGVSRYAYPADQLPYIISGGIGGLFLLGLGAMLWLSADLRDEWRKLDEIDRRNARFYDEHGGWQLPQPVEPAYRIPAPPTASGSASDWEPQRDDTRETSVVGRARARVEGPETMPPAASTSNRRRAPSSRQKPSTASSTRRTAGRPDPKPGLAQS